MPEIRGQTCEFPFPATHKNVRKGVHRSDPEFPFLGGRVFEASNRVMEVSHTVRRSGRNIADRIYFVYARERGSTP